LAAGISTASFVTNVASGVTSFDSDQVGNLTSSLPADMLMTAAIAQPLLFDSSSARAMLGWTETDPVAAVAESVAWHLANPPEDASTDFSEDDAALAGG
jgi:hypothetical protein